MNVGVNAPPTQAVDVRWHESDVFGINPRWNAAVSQTSRSVRSGQQSWCFAGPWVRATLCVNQRGQSRLLAHPARTAATGGTPIAEGPGLTPFPPNDQELNHRRLVTLTANAG